MTPTKFYFCYLMAVTTTLLFVSPVKTASVTNGTAVASTESIQVNQTNLIEMSTENKLRIVPKLSIWPLIENFWNWFSTDFSESFDSEALIPEGRTFGRIRRLQMALIPFAFKFGVMSMLITLLLFISMKTVFLLKIILLLNILALFAKFFSVKQSSYEYQHPHIAPQWTYAGGWNFPPSSKLEDSPRITPSSNKEIHLHIHGALAHHPEDGSQIQHHWARNGPYSSYYDPQLQEKGEREDLSNSNLQYSKSYAREN